MVRLQPDYSAFDADIGRLLLFATDLKSLPPHFQKLVAETILLRLFYGLENFFITAICKLVCKAQYLDGTHPRVIVNATGVQAAIQKMVTHGRVKPRYLRWTTVSELKENVEHLVDLNDHFVKVLDHNGTLIDEMRRVRNHIAHNNAKSRRDYRIVVQRHYGAGLNSVTPGILLLSDRRKPHLLEQYLVRSRVLVKQMIKA